MLSMKKIHALTILTALSLLPLSNSFAAWKELGSNEVMVVYVDLDTISDSGEKARIMSMLDFKKPGMNPKTKQPVSSIVGINEYNCPAISYRPIEYKEFAGNKGAGKVVSDNKTPNSEFEPVVSESWAAGVFNVVCQRK
ncbi:surface-adhesin E family protein [Polynucleobacter arcticus]